MSFRPSGSPLLIKEKGVIGSGALYRNGCASRVRPTRGCRERPGARRRSDRVTPEALRRWAADLRVDDRVALEATGNSDAIANLLTAIVGRVVVSNPSKTRAIAEAKVKTDKVDARILAQLLAADFLPPVWLPDDRTRALRRQVTRRAHLVRQRTRIKNQVHAILARNLAPTPTVSDLFGKTGRRWLSTQPLPADERSSVHALLRQLDFHRAELATDAAANSRCGSLELSRVGIKRELLPASVSGCLPALQESQSAESTRYFVSCGLARAGKNHDAVVIAV